MLGRDRVMEVGTWVMEVMLLALYVLSIWRVNGEVGELRRKPQAAESSTIRGNPDHGVIMMFPDGMQGQRAGREKERAEGWTEKVSFCPRPSLTQCLTSASRNRGSITSLSTCSSKWISS